MRILIDNGPPTLSISQASVDYTHYVLDGTITVEDSINVPTLVNFELSQIDNAFIKPRRGSYVTIVSDLYSASGTPGTGKILATGFVTNEPERKFLGLSDRLGPFGFQQLSYSISVTSDEWLLNAKTVSYIPAFINQTDSQILAAIANVLCPGFFNTSLMASGTLIPYYQYDPAQTWSDIAKSFADANRYHYKVINRQIIYQPFGDQPLGIAYDEVNMPQRNIYPDQLVTGVLSVPPVNDCIVLGATEPQTNWDNYFVGDGFSSNFGLRHQVFQGTTANLLQDDWTEASFNNGNWTVNDPGNFFALQSGGNPIGALNILGGTPYTPVLNATYVQAKNGLELGGGINLQHGQVTVNNSCAGIIGGVFATVGGFDVASCLCGFSVSGTASIVTASGAGGIVFQPILNGQLVGPQVVSQPNHQYVLQTWIGAQAKNRYTRPYTNLTQSATYGNQNLASNGTVTWVITDIDLGNYVIQQSNPLFGLFPAAPPPAVTKYSASGTILPPFGVYCLASSQNLNISLNYTDLSLPPQGYLTVQSLSGASGTQLPVYPNPPGPDTAVAPPGTPPSKILQPPIVYQLGFGMINQTAQVSQQGEAYALSFYSDDIPGVGSRIRFQSWEAGQACARVRDTVAIANEATVSGDDGVRSAILTNLQPPPRTSDECEAAAGAAILDREYPQFQGSYTVEVIPYRFQNLFSPSLYQYPWSGRYFYINAPVSRGVTGQNFFVTSVRTQVVELKSEVMAFSIDYGPDLYLERLLPSFLERENNLLTPTQTTAPPNPVTLPQVLNAHLPTLDKAVVVSQVNTLTGDFVIVDVGAPPVTAVEVRSVDNGWGIANQGRIGLFTSQTFTLPRTVRDQTYYLRTINGGIFSRFSKALRCVAPLIPSPPVFKALANTNLILDLNGDVRDIYGVELRLPGISGQYVLNLPTAPGTPGGLVNPTAPGPTEQVNAFSRLPLTTDTQNYNTVAYIPQVVGFQQFQFQVGDIVQVNSSVSSSVNGLKVITSTANTPGTLPTLIPNQFGNYVDSWLWPQNSGGGVFNNIPFSVPLNPNASQSGPYGSGVPPHFTGNSLLYNPVRMGQGVDPSTFQHQAVFAPNGTLISFTPFTGLNNLMRSNSTGSDYFMVVVARLDIPAPGNYTLNIAHDDGMFFGINNGATRVSGPNTTFNALTQYLRYPVMGGFNQDGNSNDTYVVNFPAAGAYDIEIDYYQWIHGQQLVVQLPGSQDIYPGYLEVVTWFDVGQPFPLNVGSQTMPTTNAGTASLVARNAFTHLSSVTTAGGVATYTTSSIHSFNVGDVVVIGARITPLSAAAGSQDASYFTGQAVITSVPSTTQFSTAQPTNTGTGTWSLIGIASQLYVNVAGTPSVTGAGNQIVVNVSGALIQRPVFAPADLVFDLTDPTIKNVIDVAQLLNPSGFSIDAYFFNLTWDYSAPLHLTQLTVPVISGLTVDPVTQQASWSVVSGVPTGYRVQIQDPTTQATFNLFTVDHPHNTQLLTQFKMLPSDYYNVRQLTVTPFNAMGPGLPITTLHNALAATGIPNTSADQIRTSVNGYIASGQIVLRADYAFDVFYTIDMVPSQAWIDNPPTSGPMVFSIQQFDVGVNGGDVGVEIGCLTYYPGSHVGTFTVPAGGSFVPGEVIKVIATSQLGASGGAGISDGAGISIDIVGTMGFSTPAPATAPPPPLGATVDLLDWFLLGGRLDPNNDRANYHMTGTGTPRYSALDTDAAQASVASTHGKHRFFLMKASSGHPADILLYDNSNPATDQIYQEITDNNDAPFQATCIGHGYPSCFSDPSAYKRHTTLMPRGPRYFPLGATITTDTPGPNTFNATADCEATSTPINLGDVRCVLSGPFTMSWGGDVGTQPTIKLQFFYGGTLASGHFADEEVFWLVQNWGWVSWEHWLNGVQQQATINSTRTAGGSPTLNFACVPGPSWW